MGKHVNKSNLKKGYGVQNFSVASLKPYIFFFKGESKMFVGIFSFYLSYKPLNFPLSCPDYP